MKRLWKSTLFSVISAAPLTLTDCNNPEYTEEDCEGMLLQRKRRPGMLRGLQQFLLFISIAELKSLHKILSIGPQGSISSNGYNSNMTCPKPLMRQTL
jgi:hypothetical protein